MSIRIEPFGEDAHLYTLENSAGTRLVLTEIGAAAISLVYRGRDILLGWDNPGRYFNGDGDLGATVGRVANRVADARFSLNGRIRLTNRRLPGDTVREQKKQGNDSQQRRGLPHEDRGT